MPCYRCGNGPCTCKDGITLIHGDCLEVLRCLPDASVQCCITSPPYWGLRDYGVAGQLGLEATPAEYVANMEAVFREVRRVLRDDGTLWLNLGDSYNAYNGGTGPGAGLDMRRTKARPDLASGHALRCKGLKPKDLVGIPWRVALALQADGWYLRQDIIWHKPNPMPESVTDRCTKAHEYLFLLAKCERYYYDAEAIKEAGSGVSGGACFGKINKNGPGARRMKDGENESIRDGTRNKRSVWTIPTQAYSEAHFATFPEKLVEPCILAGCPEGGIVLDPFNGSGTTGVVCYKHRRQYLGIDLNEEYLRLAKRRISKETSKCELLEQF